MVESGPPTSLRLRRSGQVDADLDAVLRGHAELVDDHGATLVHVVEDVDELDDLTPTLLAWVREARRAVAADADVVTIVDDRGLEHDATAPAMLVHGLVAATRALAMEHDRNGGRANLVLLGDATAAEVAGTVTWLAGTTAVTAEVVALGGARHGRLPA